MRGRRLISSAVDKVNPVDKVDPGEFSGPSCFPLPGFTSLSLFLFSNSLKYKV